MAEINVWEKLTAFCALLSVLISCLAVYLSFDGAKVSSNIATKALETSNKANDIALGLVNEPVLVEFTASSQTTFDFTSASQLNEDLKQFISVRNKGRTVVDGLSLELIGIVPFTYPTNDPTREIRPLPADNVNIKLNTLLEPGTFMHVDVRVPILKYLLKLSTQIPDKSKNYHTAINIVLRPKILGNPLPSSVRSGLTMQDTILVSVTFDPSILDSPQIKNLIAEDIISNRTYPG